jgi:hypothetical protein
LVCLLAPGAVMSLSTSINSLSRSRSDILRLSAALAACCSVCCFCFVAIVNFLSHREESGLQRTIIFRALHAANRCLTLMLTTACYLRGHVTLDCKSPVPLYALLQKRHLGCSLSQPPECFLARSAADIVLRSSSWSVAQVQLCEASVFEGLARRKVHKI